MRKGCGVNRFLGSPSAIFCLLATSDSQLRYAWKYKFVQKLMNFVGVWTFFYEIA